MKNRIKWALAISGLSLALFLFQNASQTNDDIWIHPDVFVASEYKMLNPDLANYSAADLRWHWLNHGINEGRIGSVYFSSREYLDIYPDLRKAFGANGFAAAIQHFVLSGRAEQRVGRQVLRSSVFDPIQYALLNPDLGPANSNADIKRLQLHWLGNGLVEGRRGNLTFFAPEYLSLYGDLARGYGANNYAGGAFHYARHGQAEGRSPQKDRHQFVIASFLNEGVAFSKKAQPYVYQQTGKRFSADMLKAGHTEYDPNYIKECKRLSTYALANLSVSDDPNLVNIANDHISRVYNWYFEGLDQESDAPCHFMLPSLIRTYMQPASYNRLTAKSKQELHRIFWQVFAMGVRDLKKMDPMFVNDTDNLNMTSRASVLLAAQVLRNLPEYRDRQYGGKTPNDMYQSLNRWTRDFLKVRAMNGLMAEMASPSYEKVFVINLYNTCDFSDNASVRDLSCKALDLYWAIVAQDLTPQSEARGGASARHYKYNTTANDYQMRSWFWLYGWTNDYDKGDQYIMIPALSTYRIPALITELAIDPYARYLAEMRVPGLGVTERHPVTNEPSQHTLAIENADSAKPLTHILRRTTRTPAFVVGSMTYMPGKSYTRISQQNREALITFAGNKDARIAIMGVSRVIESDPSLKRKGSWYKTNGDLSSISEGGTLIARRHTDSTVDQWNEGMRVFISDAAGLVANLDRSQPDWIFTRTKLAYVAIGLGKSYSYKRLQTKASPDNLVVDTIDGVSLESQSKTEESPIVVEVAEAKDFKNFDDFKSRMLATTYQRNGAAIGYKSLSGTIFNWKDTKTLPAIGGQTVDLNPAAYTSPYIRTSVASQSVRIFRTGRPELVLNFK